MGCTSNEVTYCLPEPTIGVLYYMMLCVYIYSFQAIAPLTAHEKGEHFFGEHISLKNGTFCPLLATIQALSKARVFLLCHKYSRMVSMGHTFTANKPLPLNNCPEQFEYSRLSRRNGAKLYPRGDYSV
jgi:hypothetical protein